MLEGNDSKKNKILTNHAIYNENLKILKSICQSVIPWKTIHRGNDIFR